MKVTRGRHRRPGPRILAVLAALVLALAGLVGLAPGATAANDTSRATLLIHGINFFASSVDCSGEFGAMSRDLAGNGLRTTVVTVGYYAGDTNCSMNLHTYGRARGADYGDNDPWKKIARAMSWYIYDAWTARGAKVDIVGYSMGGLIARGAIYGSQIGEPGFAPPLDVGNAVTLGAPFGGGNYTWLCAGSVAPQCISLAKDSTELRWLNRSCDAQGKYSTLWTVLGSSNDSFVTGSSATQMCTFPDRRFVLDYVTHLYSTNYTHTPWALKLVRNSLGGQTSLIRGGPGRTRCLDVKNMGTGIGIPVQSFDCNGTYAQVWTRERTGYTSEITALGECLDVAGAKFKPGTLVQLWPCNGSTGQQWTQVGGTIRSGGYCLAAPDNNWNNFTQLEIWDCNGGPGELWS